MHGCGRVAIAGPIPDASHRLPLVLVLALVHVLVLAPAAAWRLSAPPERQPATHPSTRTSTVPAGLSTSATSTRFVQGLAQPNCVSGTSRTEGGTLKYSCGSKPKTPATRLLGNIWHLLR